ncbi:hypothetical protein PLICRDRAFT_25881 [Plicaturopsis crispa FD-325 SS-3]|nr:hypothetical protein PLICRDRAFT_25881 [Plicaturopsis crispa FD-325 SS-3]
MSHTAVAASKQQQNGTRKASASDPPKPKHHSQQQQPVPTKPTSKEHPPPPPPPPPAKQPHPQPAVKKISRRSSKPIINWFQRKLAGTVRNTRRASDGSQKQIAAHAAVEAARSRAHGSATVGAARPTTRVSSSPFPQPGTPPSHRRSTGSRHGMSRRTISLNDNDRTEDLNSSSEDEDDTDRMTNGSSIAQESTWSPSAMEADEDASVRPIAPSAPPSPSPSRSSSSYLSDPRTFRSMAASTKPTTLLSIDLTPNGVAHIAQAPTTPGTQAPRFPAHVRNSSTGTSAGLLGSGASITFSALPPSPQSSRPSSPRNAGSVNSSNPSPQAQVTSVQAPLHTSHHPRNNPRPSSPPLDNASVLTLASSAFAMPRAGAVTPGWSSIAPSGLGGGDSISHFGGSLAGGGEGENDGSSHYVLGDDDRENDAEGERDVDASVRALRPRSSRRGSWGSEASGWSARVGGAGTGTSLARERSIWTTNSMKTGGQFSADQEDLEGEDLSPASAEDRIPIVSSSPSPIVDTALANTSLQPAGVEITPRKQSSTDDYINAAHAFTDEKSDAHPELLHSAVLVQPGISAVRFEREGGGEGDDHSIAATDNLTDVWHSAPSTPAC